MKFYEKSDLDDVPLNDIKAITEALRSGLHPEELGLVKAVRTARKGGLLIEFEGSVKDHTRLGKKITEVTRESVEVRYLVPTATVVIDGLVTATTVEEGAIRAFIEAGLAATLETLGDQGQLVDLPNPLLGATRSVLPLSWTGPLSGLVQGRGGPKRLLLAVW
ncbi:hypothetical protein KQX54_011996 [Cotesia glomerata]|uniref:Uncharacterized protein n=1 Tax=Cotesia glomerata TaxID=32391 RepID=A0AAV7I2K5_COTGL|nr:hypothetical protein KQX54_011996 [Cotesia glomerata]